MSVCVYMNMGEVSSIHQLEITHCPKETGEEEVKDIVNNMTNIDKKLIVEQSLPKLKKFAKKVTWSNQLISIKIMILGILALMARGLATA